MEHYAIYKNKGDRKAAYPYLLNVLHPAASGFANTVMVPLVPLARMAISPLKNCARYLRFGTNIMC